MVRGYPDYSPGVGRTKEGDFLQELVGPPVWFEDDFESPLLKWEPTRGTINLYSAEGGAGVDSVVYSGSACLSMLSAANDYAKVERTIGLPPLDKKIGIEINLRFPYPGAWYSATIGDTIPIYVGVYTEDEQKTYYISYVPSTYKWYLSSDDGSTWTDITTHQIYGAANHIIKLVIDPVNDKYDKLYVDNVGYDLSAYDGYSTAVAIGTALEIAITVHGTGVFSALAYIDNFKLTYNEE